MSLISLQGLCYFQVASNRVVVHLPVGGCDANHQDGTPAAPHYAGIFIDHRLVVDQSGFGSCEFTSPKGETFEGLYFPLSSWGSNRPLLVQVSEQGRSAPKTSDLKKKLPSFSQFVPGNKPLRPIPGKAAARVVIKGGSFNFEPSKKYSWEIGELGTSNTKKSLGRVSWKVDWHTGAPAGTLVRISVHNDFDAGPGPAVAWVEYMAGSKDPKKLIIGNLDFANPAQWPSRENMTAASCQGPDGMPSGGTSCYDNDFKWFYRLFDEQDLLQRFANSGLKYLPVPQLKSSSRKKGATPSVPIGFDTPTCFPGTD